MVAVRNQTEFKGETTRDLVVSRNLKKRKKNARSVLFGPLTDRVIYVGKPFVN